MNHLIRLFLLCLLIIEPMSGGHGVSASDVVPELWRKGEADSHCRQWVDAAMTRMTLKEKIGQLFIYTIEPSLTKRNLALLREVVQTYRVGGLLFSGGKLQNQAELTNRAQAMARVPMLITFDGEWGLAMRLRGTPVFPRNLELGCIRDNDLIREYGREMARQCRELGVQVNFAPVADVNTNPHNPVINVRSFGESPEAVSEKVIAYARGLEEGGVLSVAKHFPGHGDTDTDSHKVLPRLSFDRGRLDSVELHPFRAFVRAGLSGVMVGHLEVPSLESQEGLPASLSRNVVNDLLTEELGFGGLIFTDALAMKGVAAHRNVCLQALKAGNDLVLAPRRLKEEFQAVVDAVESGELSVKDIDRKCRKVLTYKYVLGLKKKPHVRLSGLAQRIHTSQTSDLIRRLRRASVTIPDNSGQVLPLYTHPKRPIALLEVGESNGLEALAERMSTHAPVRRFSLPPDLSGEEARRLCDSLNTHHRVIVAVSDLRLTPYQSFFADFAPERPVAYLFFTPAGMMLQLNKSVKQAGAVVLAHSADADVQRHVGDLLFAAASADGRLPASIGSLFAEGAGVNLTTGMQPHLTAEDLGFSAERLLRIDSIAQAGIRGGAYPGCQVVVLKDGQVLVDKSFGTFSGMGSPAVDSTSLYDLASLTKTTATLLAVMKLYDKGSLNLTDRVSDHLPFLKGTNKEKITVQELLFHQSGLPAGIAFYQEAIDKESYKGKLFSNRKDARHSVSLGGNVWANPHFKFNSDYISDIQKPGFLRPVSKGLWVGDAFREVMERKIADAPLKAKTYVYSDVGFVLLGMLVEQLAGMSLDEYLQREFYIPMGLKRTGYLPLRRFSAEQIVPTANDRFLRKSWLQGYVHDETAAFCGGVAGNAGLFSTAGELASVYLMLLDGGLYRGSRYLSEPTCRLFTATVSKISRRGLGFDKPDPVNPEKGNCAPNVPAEVYGHTGFTGTCAWVDPVNRLVYVFLSNRVCPDVSNRVLIRTEIREQIQAAIYEAMLP